MVFQHSIEGAYGAGGGVFLRLENHHPPSPHIQILTVDRRLGADRNNAIDLKELLFP
jgi:hypothetical protein